MANKLANLLPGGKIGHKGGGGRPPDWVKRQFGDAVIKGKGPKFLQEVIGGKMFMKTFVIEGKIVHQDAYPTLSERTEAIKLSMDRFQGKAVQAIAEDPQNPIGGIAAQINADAAAIISNVVDNFLSEK